MQPVVIVGGGISGLSAAYYLSKLSKLKNVSLGKIILVESSNRLGGWVDTFQNKNGALHELGPRSLRKAGKSGENTISLINELGIEDDVLIKSNSDPNVGNRYIASSNELCKLPNRFLSIFFKQKPFSKPFYSYAFNEFKTPRLDLSNQSLDHLGDEKAIIKRNEDLLGEQLEDVDIHKMISLRIGDEVADHMFDPLLRGITSGNARTISFRSMFGELFKNEREYGSILKGVYATSKKNSKKQRLDNLLNQNTQLSEKLKSIGSNCIFSFREGVVQLPNTMMDCLRKDSNVEIRLNNRLNGLEIDENGRANLTIDDGKQNYKIKADQVFFALNANDLSKCLPEDQNLEILKSTLSSIKSASVATISLEINKKNLLNKYPGFGFLIPSHVNSSILGVVFDSLVFPELNGPNEVTRLSVMAGGDWYSELCKSDDQLDESKLLEKSSEVLRKYLQITDDPSFIKINVLKNCIPQYRVGHYLKLKVIDQIIGDKNLKLSLIGSSYSGVSLNDCVYNSRLKVEEYLEQQ